MTDERFSLRYNYEEKPGNPIFDEAPKRLRFLVIRSFQKYFYLHQVPLIIGEALCRPELITKGIEREEIWEVLFPYIENATGWEIYNLIESMHSKVKEIQNDHGNEFEKDVNRLFGEESIGWQLKDGKLQRTLPMAARVQVDTVFKELEHPRFAPALAHITAAYKAYNARPRRDFDVCSSAFDACESVAKEIFGIPTGTFGDALKEARSKNRCTPETINTLEKLYALASNHFRHGMTEPFALGSPEVDFVYLTCLAAILLFARLA
jgi:hypothetical protein